MYMNYKDFVELKLKSPIEISENMTPHKAHLIHLILGIEGEAGELLDPIKKHVIYGKDLDMDNIVEEMGDLEFFLEGLRSHLSLDRDEIIKKNQDKLNKRYASKYTDKEAIERNDK